MIQGRHAKKKVLVIFTLLTSGGLQNSVWGRWGVWQYSRLVPTVCFRGLAKGNTQNVGRLALPAFASSAKQKSV
jgi:hypothetical protein